MARLLLAVLLAACATLAGAQDFKPVPPLQARVTDMIGMLGPEQRNSLETVLREYESRTGSQIAVLLISSTAPETIEQYGIRVADSWKIGRKGIDDGAILIVARDNPPDLRRLRIEAGYGAEGTLTDAQSKRILQDIIAPHFRQNDFYGGLVAGVSAIASLLDKGQFPAAEGRQQAGEDSGSSLLFFLFFAFVVISMMSSRRRRSRHYRLSNAGWGHHASGIILGSAIGSALGRGGMGHGGGGGFGGFSGGGGGFGGGGASGDW